MDKIKIYELDNYQTNSRNGTYGGKAGDKEGIDIDGEAWIVKYPKSTREMRRPLVSYTTAPLSEFIGSHVYQILGIDTHDTILGIRNNKLVVACKDFCKTEGALREIRTLKNIYNKELAEKLETSLSSTSDSHLIDLKDILTHLEYNPILKNIPEIKERFWEQLIVDVLINNNDRNNGNWGVLYEDGRFRLAPVFDNGAAFSNKTPDNKLAETMKYPERFVQSADTSRTIYRIGDEELYAKNISDINEPDFYRTAAKIIPVIKEKMNEIQEFINSIPEQYNEMSVCSEARKEFYFKSMQLKLERLLEPVLSKAEKEFGFVASKDNNTVIYNRNYFYDFLIEMKFNFKNCSVKNDCTDLIIGNDKFNITLDFESGDILIQDFNGNQYSLDELQTKDKNFCLICNGIIEKLKEFSEYYDDKTFFAFLEEINKPDKTDYED